MQVSRIPTTTYGGLTHCPCSATLLDGQHVDCVCLADAAPYIKCWGIWPDQDKGKLEIRLQDVARIDPCHFALPANHAQRLNDAGESGMGYMLFEIEYRDGSRTAHLSGCVVDFVRLQRARR